MDEIASKDGARAAADGSYSIRAVQRVCDLLDLMLNEPNGVSLMRAAQVTKLPKSSAFRYLATLEGRRYVERDPATSEYRLGLALLTTQIPQLDVLSRRARPYLEELQAEFGETTNLGMLDGSRVVYLHIVESARTMRFTARPGDRHPLHATALGKALAAQLPVERVRGILKSEGMPRLTQRTITSQRRYLDALEEVREAGYAVDDGENEVGGRCIAVGIPDIGLPLAISMSGLAARFTAEMVPTVGAHLVDAAARLAAELSPTNQATSSSGRGAPRSGTRSKR